MREAINKLTADDALEILPNKTPVSLSLIEGLRLRIGPVLNLDLRKTSSSRRSDFPSVKWTLARGDRVAAKTALATDINSAADVILSNNGLKES